MSSKGEDPAQYAGLDNSKDVEGGGGGDAAQRTNNNNFINVAQQCFILFCAAIYGYLVNTAPLRKQHFYFVEQDPDYSHPYVFPEQVPASPGLYAMTICIPLFFMFPYCVYAIWSSAPTERRRAAMYTSFYILLGFFQVLMIATCVFTTVKVLVGRPRPNFFAYCNYKGFRDAMQSNNFTAYNAVTTFGVQGDMSYCEQTNNVMLLDSVRSFPSGHAGFSFAGVN